MYSTGIDVFTVDWHGVNGLFCTSYILNTTCIEIFETVEQLNFDCSMLAVGQLMVNAMSEW